MASSILMTLVNINLRSFIVGAISMLCEVCGIRIGRMAVPKLVTILILVRLAPIVNSPMDEAVIIIGETFLFLQGSFIAVARVAISC